MKIKNIKVFAAGLCLGATLLSGCGNHSIAMAGNNVVYHEDESISGKIKYEYIQNVVILKLEIQGEECYRLAYKKNYYSCQKVNSSGVLDDFIKLCYIDLKTGVTLIDYYYFVNSKEDKEYQVGANLIILDEIKIDEWLIAKDKIKRVYDVNELISFYDEEILPTLTESDKIKEK